MKKLLNHKIIKIFLITFCILNLSPQKVHAMEWVYSKVESLFNKLFSEPQLQQQREDRPKIDPKVEPPKKRARRESPPPSPIYVDSEENNYDSDVKISNPQAPEIKLIQSLQQIDGWRCGYFSAFNCFQLKQITPEILIETLNQLDLSNLAEEFNTALRKIFFRFKYLQTSYQQKHELNASVIQDALIALFDVTKFENLENISVIEMANFDSTKLYPEYYVIKNIQNLRQHKIPQLIILHQNNHWTTWIITKEVIWGTNSLQDYDQANIDRTLIRIFNYFNYQPLPSFENIKPLIKQLKQAKTEEEIEHIKQFAHQQGFTMTQFEQLAQKHFSHQTQDRDDVQWV